MNSFEALVSLNMLPQLGGERLKNLLEHFSTAEKIFLAGWSELSAIVPPGICQGILSFDAEALERELKSARDLDLEIITLFDGRYPRLLKEIPSPPLVLYLRGEIRQTDTLGIAIVGSRAASWYGLSSADKFSRELAQRGLTVISGLARGIDTAAHRGSLKAGGRTIAVMGSGFRHIYPEENRKLADEIARNGAVVSEFPLDSRPLAQNFPRRNRIISGLSLGVLVVEAARNSGAMITADFALEQGREVFALPGKVDCSGSFGPHELIKQGAKLVSECRDILEELPLPAAETLSAPVLQEARQAGRKNVLFDKEESRLYDYITLEAVEFDALLEKTHLTCAQLAGLILSLRLKKLVRELPGKYYVRN